MMRDVIIIGGGVAGMKSAVDLSAMGFKVLLIEKSDRLGGKLLNWHCLFPTFTAANEVLTQMLESVEAAKNVEVIYSTEVTHFDSKSVTTAENERLECRAVILASGFTLFDARIKEEYGYGIYNGVYTTVDLERMFNEGTLPQGDKAPMRIALLHCVGSRDEKICQSHCSKVCCVTGVKQAVELKKVYPNADIFNFYMDIRMFGPGYEEMYRDAQIKSNIHFVRGRISEAAPTMDGKIQIKAEDTLTARPLRMSVDMLILIVGMRGNDSNEAFAKSANLKLSPNGFMQSRDSFLNNTSSNQEGIFYAGAITAPKNIGESLGDGAHAAQAVYRFLTK
ncbi:MAG: FAD-dependent oxidoreductase [Rikenellaceae bacterium]